VIEYKPGLCIRIRYESIKCKITIKSHLLCVVATLKPMIGKLTEVLCLPHSIRLERITLFTLKVLMPPLGQGSAGQSENHSPFQSMISGIIWLSLGSSGNTTWKYNSITNDTPPNICVNYQVKNTKTANLPSIGTDLQSSIFFYQ